MTEKIDHLDFQPDDEELRKDLKKMAQAGSPDDLAKESEARDQTEEPIEKSSYDVYHQNEEFLENWRQERRDAVFGKQELESIEGHEASEESTQAVVNAIMTLTQEKAREQEEYKFPNARKLQRRLHSRDENGHLKQQVWLNYYPDGATGASPNVSGNAIVDLSALRYGEQVVPGHEGKARTRDDMYVDKDTGKTMITRAVDLSRWNSPNHGIAAEREATEEEVQEALDLITELVKEEQKAQQVTEAQH